MKTLVCLTIGLSGFLANPGGANAQRPFSHHNQDGFGQVSEMAQDSAGFLWISSTHFGRFDGYRLIEYTDSQGELIQGRITVSPGGTVWVHGRRLLHYDRQTDSFKDHGVETNDAFALAFDEAERLWLGIWGKGLALYDPIEGTIENFTNPP